MAFAGYATAVAVFCGPGEDRSWGISAAAAYAVAAFAAARWRSHGRAAALLASLVGAVAVPLAWLTAYAPPTPDVRVVARAGTLLLRDGSPYLPAAQLGHLASAIGYNPYLPVMTIFGLPRAIGMPGVIGDPRLWLGAVSLALLTLAFSIAGRPDPLRCGLFAVASPVVAFPLALGVTDPPVLALVCLALALLGRSRRPLPLWPAALALGTACAMKATAWPALPVFAAMLAARDGARSAARFTAATAGTAAVLVVAAAPTALARPGVLIENTVLFPLGLTRVKTPAESPLPGHLLAIAGPAGRLTAIGLLIAAGLAIAVSLVVRPPADGRAAAARLALGLTLMFALSPATRLGYFAYPIGLWGWLALCDGVDRAPAVARIRLRARRKPASALLDQPPDQRPDRPPDQLPAHGDAHPEGVTGAATGPERNAPVSEPGRSIRLRGLLDRSQGYGYALVRSLGAIGYLVISVVAEPLVEHRDAFGEELP